MTNLKIMEFPESVKKMKGKEFKFNGKLFSQKKSVDMEAFTVLDYRWSSAHIVSMETMKRTNPAFELLLKNDNMKRSQWTRPFPCREYIPDEDEGWKLAEVKETVTS